MLRCGSYPETMERVAQGPLAGESVQSAPSSDQWSTGEKGHLATPSAAPSHPQMVMT